jgi:hypothetical protein
MYSPRMAAAAMTIFEVTFKFKTARRYILRFVAAPLVVGICVF